MLKGITIIKGMLKSIPTKPGVYRMLGRNNKILYVGKARNLAARLSNYTNASRLASRTKLMLSLTESLVFITTESDREAILLEANLIKSLKPKYNILLKDDKSFPYILAREDHDYGQILKYRGTKDIKGKYFGPFASISAVEDTIELAQKTFKLRNCGDNYFKARKRPCLQYQIKRCSAPCVGKISKTDYACTFNQAVAFLSGKTKNLHNELKEAMELASEKLEYEKAAKIRDQIQSINYAQSKQFVAREIDNADVLAIYKGDELSCIQLFTFRNGQNYGNKAFFPEHAQDTDMGEILRVFISQFYQNYTSPRQLLTNVTVEDQKELEEIFSFKILTPKAGDKFRMVELAERNAEHALSAKAKINLEQVTILKTVKELFSIKRKIRRIEVYDNSHIQGSFAVGAMIVAGESGFMKKYYRKYNIQQTEKSDDYAMLREVLDRRLKRLAKEYPQYQQEIWPDLILIDGGPGHLSVAKEVFNKYKLDIEYACIAKGPDRNAGRENFYTADGKIFTLPKEDKVMKYLQVLRDEAHRFAITTHRAKRNKALTNSLLDDIPGVGKRRKNRLLTHFGSVKAIRASSVQDLTKVDGINKTTATVILEFLNS
jgi:excinuclease ABC subunit C